MLKDEYKKLQEMENAHQNAFAKLKAKHKKAVDKMTEAHRQEFNAAATSTWEALKAMALKNQEEWLDTLPPEWQQITDHTIETLETIRVIGPEQQYLLKPEVVEMSKALLEIPSYYFDLRELTNKFVVVVRNSNGHNYPMNEPAWFTNSSSSAGKERIALKVSATQGFETGNYIRTRPLEARPATLEEVEKMFSKVTNYYGAISAVRRYFSEIFSILNDEEDESEEDLSPA